MVIVIVDAVAMWVLGMGIAWVVQDAIHGFPPLRGHAP